MYLGFTTNWGHNKIVALKCSHNLHKLTHYLIYGRHVTAYLMYTDSACQVLNDSLTFVCSRFFPLKTDNWIIGLAIMVYEPLHHALQIW